MLGLVSLEGDLFTQIDCLLCTDKSVSLPGGLEQCVEAVTLEAFRRDVGISRAQRRWGSSNESREVWWGREVDRPKGVQLVGFGRRGEGRIGYGRWTFGGRGGDGDLREYDMHWRRGNGGRHQGEEKEKARGRRKRGGACRR